MPPQIVLTRTLISKQSREPLKTLQKYFVFLYVNHWKLYSHVIQVVIHVVQEQWAYLLFAIVKIKTTCMFTDIFLIGKTCSWSFKHFLLKVGTFQNNIIHHQYVDDYHTIFMLCIFPSFLNTIGFAFWAWTFTFPLLETAYNLCNILCNLCCDTATKTIALYYNYFPISKDI